MRRARTVRPSIESMESKQLLSGPGGGGIIPSAPVVAVSGVVVGTFHQPSGIHPDVGARIELSGSGRLAHFGRATLTGEIDGTGFIRASSATGTITLANAKGTLTLTLKGPSQAGFSGLPTSFDFAVTRATGVYAKDLDVGHLTLHLASRAGHVSSAATSGRFRITLTSDPQASPF